MEERIGVITVVHIIAHALGLRPGRGTWSQSVPCQFAIDVLWQGAALKTNRRVPSLSHSSRRIHYHPLIFLSIPCPEDPRASHRSKSQRPSSSRCSASTEPALLADTSNCKRMVKRDDGYKIAHRGQHVRGSSIFVVD